MKIRLFRLAVYVLDGGAPLLDPPTPPGIIFKPFEAEDIARFFAADPLRAETFREFLARGYRGVLAHDTRAWVGYGWLTGPDSPAPPHLPAWVHAEHQYWLFYAHTRIDCRGRGVQKALIRRRLDLVPEKDGGRPPVLSDTDVGNLASRRALLAMGLRPMGTLTCLTLRLPTRWPLALGWWTPHAVHPVLASAPKEVAP